MSGAWDSNGAGRCGYWPGAFSPGAPRRKDKQKQKDKKNTGGEDEQKNKKPLFPAYDNKKGGVAKVQPSSGTDLIRVVSSSKEDTIVRDLQRRYTHVMHKQDGLPCSAATCGQTRPLRRLWAKSELLPALSCHVSAPFGTPFLVPPRYMNPFTLNINLPPN